MVKWFPGCNVFDLMPIRAQGWMRDTDKLTGELFSYVDLELRVPTERPASSGVGRC